METMPNDNEILTFVHNPRDEIGAANSRGVFDDRRVNNKKRGASCSNANQNRRGEKIKGTQQSQVLLTTQESTRTERPRTRRVVDEKMLQIRSEGAAQKQAKQRQPSSFVPPRKKSERLQNLKVAEALTQGPTKRDVELEEGINF
nr:hypothetical protein [Tanacetum cinerariifolium]